MFTGYERERDAVDGGLVSAAASVDSTEGSVVRARTDQRYVHVETDVPLKHGGAPGALVLHAERHRRDHAVAQVRDLKTCTHSYRTGHILTYS